MAALSFDYDVTRKEIACLALLGTALATGLAVSGFPAAAALLSGLLCWMMLLIALIDYRQFAIPDVLSLTAIPIGLAAARLALARDWENVFTDHALAALVAGGAFWAIRIAYRRLRGVEGLGFGDVKLAAVAGAWLGLEALPMACLLASVGALLGALFMKAGDAGLKTRIPFGSAIAPAIVIMWLEKLLA